MKTSSEVEIVWEIWHLISRLNDLIWDLYENEFMYILEKKESIKSEISDEDFPFWRSEIRIYKTDDNPLCWDDKCTGMDLSIGLGLNYDRVQTALPIK